MKAVYTTLILSVALGSNAWAGDFDSTSKCGQDYFGRYSCNSTSTFKSGGGDRTQGEPIGKEQVRRLKEEEKERFEKWEQYCKPVGRVDKMGVTRLQYAHEGCDLGRTGDDETQTVEARR